MSTSDPSGWPLGTSTALFRTKERRLIERTRAAGITQLEISIKAGDPDTAKLQPIADWAFDLEMAVHSIHLPYGWEWDVSELDRAKRHHIVAKHLALIEQATAWRPKVAVIHGSYAPIPLEERDERIQTGRESLAELSEASLEYGVELCVEVLPKTCIGNTSGEILRLIDGIPTLGVCCDVNHLFHESPVEFIDRIGNRIKTLHISDYDGEGDRHWIPGTGTIDWPHVLDALVRAEYRSVFMFEVVSRPNQEPVDPQVLGDWWRTTLQGKVSA